MMASRLFSSEWPEHLRFFGQFLRHPRAIGAVAPSSKWLAREMIAAVSASARPVTVVELGTGMGAFTGAILACLGPQDRFLGVDIEPAFVDRVLRRWPDADCVCGSAENLQAILTERGVGPLDHIVSGLPFASLPVATTGRILDAVATTLRPGGTFTTFQYVHAYGLPPAVAFRRQMNVLLESSPEARLVARNLPPAFALCWTNRLAGMSRPR